MLKEYSISDLSDSLSDYIPYFVGTFEGTDDPDIEWPHRHSFYSFVWFTEGSGSYVIDFEEYDIKPQRVFLVDTKQVHNWDYSENSKGYILMTDAAMSVELDLNSPLPYLDISLSDSELFARIFLNLEQEFNLKDSLSGKNVKRGIQYLYSLIGRIAKNSDIEAHVHDPILEQIRTLAFQHASLFSTDEYAAALNISSEQLNNICKSSLGISAKQYLLDIKMTEAKRLLLFNSLNINEIAFRLGFEDPSYFSRLFKKKTSLSPSLFLKKYRKQG